MKLLENKVAIITGSAQGIGLATALRFAAEGARVVVSDIGPQRVEQAVAAIELEVGDAEVEKTLDVLRKQRTTFVPAERAAQAPARRGQQ